MDMSVRVCEECGYPVEGLPAGAVCPECGAAVPRTRDERRPGSAWQRSPGVAGWLSVTWSMLRRPAPTMSAARIDARSSGRLHSINTALAAAAIGVGGVRVLGYDALPRVAIDAVRPLVVFLVGSLAAAGVVFLLTAIESRGIRFFGARKGWRVTREVAATVCGHASIGWTIGGVLVLLASTHYPVQWASNAGVLQRFWFVRWIPAAAGAFFVGLLIFECLVYVGVRRCRFANLPDSVTNTDSRRE